MSPRSLVREAEKRSDPTTLQPGCLLLSQHQHIKRYQNENRPPKENRFVHTAALSRSTLLIVGIRSSHSYSRDAQGCIINPYEYTTVPRVPHQSYFAYNSGTIPAPTFTSVPSARLPYLSIRSIRHPHRPPHPHQPHQQPKSINPGTIDRNTPPPTPILLPSLSTIPTEGGNSASLSPCPIFGRRP